ncbi:hypothetical protein PINS_up019531 [Pythium insidiosum]|nr:hypothetical protein PINS_up019531 [Pythium insidiosum]
MAHPQDAASVDDLYEESRYERLLETIFGSMRCPAFNHLTVAQLPESAASCAAFDLHIPSYVSESSADVGELLRVLHLLARSNTCAAVFRLGVHGSGSFDGCPLSGWCAYCGGEDRSIALHLTWRSSPKALETALFDWDESKANADFQEMKKAVEDIENASAKTTKAPHKRPLIQLSVTLSPQRQRWGQCVPRPGLGELLQRYRDAESRGELQLFCIKSVWLDELDDAATESVIQSGLPIVIGESNWTGWQWVIKALGEDAWSASSTLLARGNMTSLWARVYRSKKFERGG